MFKHVYKQRKLTAQNREAHLSDEDSSGNSASDSEEDSASDHSGSDDDGNEDEVSEEGSEEEDGEDEEEVEEPPPGFPTAAEAADNPIATPVPEEGEDSVPVCVVCPSKVLKAGRMLEVHLGSKDHVRRLKRFKDHITSPSFPSASLELDARHVAAQLDKVVLVRLSDQTQFGGNAISTASAPSTTAPFLEAPSADDKEKRRRELADAQKRIAAEERRSVRSVKKETQKALVAQKRLARKEKRARLAAKNAGAEASEKPASTVKPPRPKNHKPHKPKPSAEEIAKRQAAKLAKRSATAAPSKQVPVAKAAVDMSETKDKVKSKGKKRKAAGSTISKAD